MFIVDFVAKSWLVIQPTLVLIKYIHTVFENHRKVSCNIANEASYVYILSGPKLIKNAKYAQFGEFLKT